MLVTFFENIERSESYFRSYSEFIDQVEVNGELTYVINSAHFSGQESIPFKVFRGANYGFACYCSKDADAVKSLGAALIQTVGECSAEVPISFCLKSKKHDDSYSRNGYAEIIPAVQNTAKNISLSLRDFGVNVKKFRITSDNLIILSLDSLSFADMIADVEFTRFFCYSLFSSEKCHIHIPGNYSQDLNLKLKFLKKIKANEKKKIQKISQAEIIDDTVSLVGLQSNMSIQEEIISVVSQVSP